MSCSLRLIPANAEGSGFVNDKNQSMKWVGQNASGFLPSCVCERIFSHTSMRMRAHTDIYFFIRDSIYDYLTELFIAELQTPFCGLP